MTPVALDQVRAAGALDIDVTPEGVVFRRLPAWTRHQLVDPALMMMVTMPAGVRLEFETDAEEIEIDAAVTTVEVDDPVPVPVPVPATFDLVVGDELVASVPATSATRILFDSATGVVEHRPGDPATIRFEGVATTGWARVEIWLPHNAAVELRELRVSDGATITPWTSGRPRWIHYGSSISHCNEAPNPTATWPAIAARRAGVDLQNLAFAGQCLLDPFVARTIRDLGADAISLKIGINLINADAMRERSLVPALHGFLDTIRDGHPTTPLMLISPIACPIVEDHPGPTVAGGGRFHTVARSAELSWGALTLRRIRELWGEVVAERRAVGDSNLHLLDGQVLFGPADVGDLYDDLHPTAAAYRRMGDRFHELAFARGGLFHPLTCAA